MDRASGVWTVRGVSAEARKLAKAKAVEKGWTVGQWIEQAIERSARPGETEEPEKKSPKATVEVYGLRHGTEEPVHLATVDSEGGLVEHEKAVEPIRAHARKPRSVCVHGVEKGYNCWQCGGLAVIR